MSSSAALDPNQPPQPETESTATSANMNTASSGPAMGLGDAQMLLEDRSAKNATQAKQTAEDVRANVADSEKATEGVAAVDMATNTAQQPAMAEAARVAEEHAALLQANIGIRQNLLTQLDTLERTSSDLAADRLKDSWANAGTGPKLFGTLAQMFGAFTSGVMGGPNIPADMIHNTLMHDLEVQKYNLLHRQQGVTNRRGILSDMMSVYNNVDLAHAAAYAATKDALGKRLDQIASSYKNPKIIASVAQAKAALEQKGLEQTNKLKEHYTDQQNDLTKAEAELSAKQAAADAMMQRQTQAQGHRQFAEWDGSAVTDKQFNDLDSVYRSTTNLVDQIAKAKEFALSMKRTDPASQQLLASKLAAIFSVMRGPAFEATGANLSEEEVRKLEAQIPGLFKGNVMPQTFAKLMDELATRQSERSMNAFMRSGFRPKEGNMLIRQYQALHGGAK